MAKISLQEIEKDAANSPLPYTDYLLCLWIFLLKKENRTNVKLLAKELNIRGTPANVYYSIKERLCEGVAIQ